MWATVFRRYLRAVFEGTIVRGERMARTEYEHVFSVMRNPRNIEDRYLAKGLYEVGGRLVPRSQFDYEVDYLLGRVIDEIRREPVESVLEIGSGPGLNVLAVARSAPVRMVAALELTRAGLSTATALEVSPPERLLAPYGGRRPVSVRWVRGSGFSLPFADRSVDVVFTKLALEQMGSFWPRAIAEIRRVARRKVVMCELFYDRQRSWRERMHLISVGSARQTLDGLRAAGFRVERVESLTRIHKIKDTPSLVVLRP